MNALTMHINDTAPVRFLGHEGEAHSSVCYSLIDLSEIEKQHIKDLREKLDEINRLAPCLEIQALWNKPGVSFTDADGEPVRTEPVTIHIKEDEFYFSAAEKHFGDEGIFVTHSMSYK